MLFLWISFGVKAKDSRGISIDTKGISAKIFVFKDSLSQYNLSQVSDSLSQTHFISDKALKFDSKSKTYWLRVHVKGSNSGRQLWTLKIGHIDTLELYLPKSGGGFTKYISGENIPFKERAVQYGEFNCFSIPITDTVSVFYLRLTSASFYSLGFRRLADIKFISPSIFDSLSRSARYFHGIFLGIMLAMIIFNLIIYGMYRDKSYSVYSGFMVTQTLYHLSITGFLQEFVFYDYPQFGKHFPFFIAGISIMGYALFSQTYLEAKKYTPRLNKVYRWIYPIVLTNFIIGYFYNIRLGNSALLVSGLFVIIIPFAMAISAYKRKYRPAIFFLIASVLSYIAYCIYVPMGLKLIPEVFVTRYSFQISFALQSLLFAMGLADRMNSIRKELVKKKIEKEQLEKEQEIALKNILEKQNEQLEIKVQERTLELEVKNKVVEQDRKIIQAEREKSDKLLLNILPEKIANRLKSGENMIAERFDNVTVLFSDIVGFTNLSKRISPEDLVGILNSIFSELDKLALQFGLEKIKTIGDAYMCVCGLPEAQEDHAERAAKFALGAINVIKKLTDLPVGEEISVRIGIHSGTVVAGVIGNQKFAYDLWGETVNTASRLESQGERNKIQCSEATYQLVKDKFLLEERGETDLKGLGTMKTYFIIKQL